MGRKRKPRWVDFQPSVTYFKPRGVALTSLSEVDLSLDEVEAIRLADLEKMEQTKAAKRMKISQSTFQRILKTTHRKIARALILGKAIRMKGGEVIMPRGRGVGQGIGRGTGRGAGRGAGRGRMGGPFAAGPGGICLCTNPECKHEAAHQAGVPCYQTKCPKCGSPMVRKR
jgi:predicted DNA-binding protein (UPF0251 family)